MSRWEYTIYGVGDGDTLNELGEDGWEAVSVFTTPEQVRVLMKRPKAEPAPPITECVHGEAITDSCFECAERHGTNIRDIDVRTKMDQPS